MSGLKTSLKYLGLGTEILAAFAIPAIIGLLIDYRIFYQEAGYGLIIGLVLGLILVFFRLKAIVEDLSQTENEQKDRL